MCWSLIFLTNHKKWLEGQKENGWFLRVLLNIKFWWAIFIDEIDLKFDLIKYAYKANGFYS